MEDSLKTNKQLINDLKELRKKMRNLRKAIPNEKDSLNPSNTA